MIAATVLDIASQAGTLSMQALLLGAIVALWIKGRNDHRENKQTTKDFIDRLERKETDMSEERRQRIGKLMDMQGAETAAKVADAAAKTELASAIRNQSQTIVELRNSISDLRELISEMKIELIHKHSAVKV